MGECAFIVWPIGMGLQILGGPDGFKDTVTPRAMSVEEIASTVADYGVAAKNAREAGFDGVELHAATTYLLPEFLNSALNIREDAYGGSAANRTRIVLEVLDALMSSAMEGERTTKRGDDRIVPGPFKTVCVRVRVLPGPPQKSINRIYGLT